MQRCTEMSPFLGGVRFAHDKHGRLWSRCERRWLACWPGQKVEGGLEIQHSNFSMQIHLRPFLHIFVSWGVGGGVGRVDSRSYLRFLCLQGKTLSAPEASKAKTDFTRNQWTLGQHFQFMTITSIRPPRTGVAHVYGTAATASLVLLYLCVLRL